MRCTVPTFVWTCSHYFTLIMLAQYLELCIGYYTDTNNPFLWKPVQFNLPCNTGYDPSLPPDRIIRFDGEVVVRFIVFFDDGCLY